MTTTTGHHLSRKEAADKRRRGGGKWMAYKGDNRKSQKRGEGDARGDHLNAVGSHAPSLKDSEKKKKITSCS